MLDKEAKEDIPYQSAQKDKIRAGTPRKSSMYLYAKSVYCQNVKFEIQYAVIELFALPKYLHSLGNCNYPSLILLEPSFHMICKGSIDICLCRGELRVT